MEKTDINTSNNNEGASSMAIGTVQSKKLIMFNILSILNDYTDAEHRLSQKDIEDYLESKYDMKVDRKTIKTSLVALEELGYELEYKESLRPVKNKKTGEVEESYILSDFFIRRKFEDSELRLLIDSLLFSRHVPYKQCKELIEKLESLSNVYFKSRVKHIATMPQDRTDNKQLFHTIDMLDEAISQGKKVAFKYMEYGTDLKQRAKKDDAGDVRIYKVNPYQMAAKEGKYYLICNYDKYNDISNYRVERILDIEILDERVKPFEQLRGSDGKRLDLAKYMNEHIYMYCSDTIRCKLRIVRPMISDIIDLFGKDVRFSDVDDKHVDVTVKANAKSLLQFAKNYAPHVIVLEPADLRQYAKEELEWALSGYEE